MTYEQLKKDVVYRVKKKNTDGGILEGDLLYIDSDDDSLVNASANGWYDKDTDLLDETVTDFQAEIADEYRVFQNGVSKDIVTKSELEEALYKVN